jgi:uncharacterized protein (TIGR00375 family)
MQQENKLRPFFADMHIHIGATRTGKPVKITGSRSLTLANILYEAKHTKGMDLIGIIDCHSPGVLEELKEMAANHTLVEQQGGGLNYEGLTLITGTETELYDDHCKGPIHVLTFMPDLETMEKHSKWLSERMKNIHLSSQRMYGKARDLQEHVKSLGGIFIPAHIFTPFKSLYGKGVISSLSEVFDPDLIDAVELGLSSNTEMASCIQELSRYTFLSNSDAHSLEKIAREYQMLEMKNPSFNEFKLALKGEDGRRIIANYGLNPYLGKYYNTVCEGCLVHRNPASPEPCEKCGSQRIIKGVHDRIKELQGAPQLGSQDRPPYIHQIPLEFIPGLGPKTLQKLRGAFGTDMDIIHSVPAEKLRTIVKQEIAEFILAAREGTLSVQIGGGGTYGKVTANKPSNS